MLKAHQLMRVYLVQHVLVSEDRDDHPGPEAPREGGDPGGRALPPGRRGEEQVQSGEAEDPGRAGGTQGPASTFPTKLPSDSV